MISDNYFHDFIDVLNENEQNELLTILENTPFTINDFFFFPNREIFNLLLLKDDFSYLFISKNIDEIKFTINHCSISYNRMIESLNNKDWYSLFTLIEKRDLINSYLKYFYEMNEKERLFIFKSIYSSIDFSHDFFLEHEYILYELQELELKYNKKTFKKYKDDFIIIYKGVNSKTNIESLSWTTDIKIATFFANRFKNYDDRSSYILKGKVNINDILLHINNRNESEILTFYKNVIDVVKVK